MYTKISILSLFALCLLGAYADPQCKDWSHSISPGSLTQLNLVYPDNYNIKPTYYDSPSDQIEVDVKICSDDPNDPLLTNLYSTLSSGANSITLAVTNSTQQSTSPAGRITTSPLATLLAAFLSTFFFFPKSRPALAIIAGIVCIAAFTPATHASAGVTITISIGVPKQITSICENGDCFPYPIPAPTAAPTDAPTSAPTDAPTSAPTTPPVHPSYYFNLRVLILSAHPISSYNTSAGDPPSVVGGDLAALAFTSMGTPFDYVLVDNNFNIGNYLSSDGVGKYSGIVTIGDSILNATQTAVVRDYQHTFGVKWAVIGSTGKNLPGIDMGSRVTESFDITPSNVAVNIVPFLQPTASVANDYSDNWSGYTGVKAKLYPGTITDFSIATPVLFAQRANNVQSVAAAIIKFTNDETYQLHYFVEQASEYIHSKVYMPILVNWLSPGGLFIGARRLTFVVQPDDLFLGSFLWNDTTHKNPTKDGSPWYRMSAQDLQNLADFFDWLNARLPNGSYLTVEWPTNFGGIQDGFYTPANETDYLYLKALELQNKFYYLSHTWDHPCDFDTLTPDEAHANMTSELTKNINYIAQFFAAAGNDQSRWSNNSMITPCVTGLHNPGAMRALVENNITGTVSDESVDDTDPSYEPINPYHGVWSTAYPGVYFVPREALDIDYCDIYPDMVVDEYNYNISIPEGSDQPLDFEGVMAIQKMYGLQDKVAFRHDPFMLHQANGASFEYTDPVWGKRNSSLITLWMEDIIDEVLSYYNLPWIQPQMDNLVKMFQQRDAMDDCGITTTLGIDHVGNIIQVAISSEKSCEMSLSGGAVLQGARMERYGPETTAWLNLDGTTPQTFTITPIPL